MDISVIIPTANQPALLRRCLDHLSRCRHDGIAWEIVVVDNSEDRFRAENKMAVQSHDPLPIVFLEIEPEGLMQARHRGAAAAGGDVLAFIDDDSFVSETWLGGLQEAFLDPGTMLVTGPVLPEYEIAPPAWVEDLWIRSAAGCTLGYLSLYDYGPDDRALAPVAVYGCNYAIRASLFRELKGSLPDYMPRKWRLLQGPGESGLSAKVAAAGHLAAYRPACGIRHFVGARKLTVEYFEDRAFVFGIEASFNQARADAGLGPGDGVMCHGGVRGALAGWLRRSLFNKGRRWLLRRFGGGSPAGAGAELRDRLARCRARGFEEHQRQLRRSPAFREYVLREHYLGDAGAIPGDLELPC
jgi:glycosyltransferase involved in cell wall biosynthesis